MTIHKLLYHPVTLLFVTIIAITFFFSLDKSAKKTLSSTENIRVLEHEINHVSDEVILLEEKILQTESLQFQEKVVRNELLLQKEGEYILQIPDTAINNEEICENCNENEDSSPLSSWKNILF
jgi:hypothetical protein